MGVLGIFGVMVIVGLNIFGEGVVKYGISDLWWNFSIEQTRFDLWIGDEFFFVNRDGVKCFPGPSCLESRKAETSI